MDANEVRALLLGPHKMHVGTHAPDGTIHLVTMFYALDDDRVALWTHARSQKAMNLRRDPRITCLVEEGDAYDELRGVQMAGSVEIVDDYERVLSLGTRIYERYFAAPGVALPSLASLARKRVAFLVTAERVSSWDHRKLSA